jgi:outer membrane receptor protein involved in Fe transport
MLLLLAGIVFNSDAQIKSRIVGTVTDEKSGEGMIGANVMLPGTQLGAVTDVNGKYFIIGVPVGTYRLQASMIGYAKKAVTNVVVSADRVTTVDIALEPGEIEMDAVVVSAKQDKLNKEVSSTQLVATQQQITEAAGIREINTFLAKQPGIASENGYLAIRGGSADQTGTMVNGIAYNNAAVGNAETSIPLSAIEQVSVLSGGFNAEYGNFRSGLINVTTKNGSKEGYHGTFTLSRNFEHMKRFGPELSDPTAPLLAPYMNPNVAFTGTDSTWPWEPFNGWVARAAQYNAGHADNPATPLDLYLLYSWLFMTIPDYDGLLRYDSTYVVSDEQKSLFAQHARKEQGVDYNFDGGFGGPIPYLIDEIGATFYISNTTSKQYYTIPVVRNYELKTTTLATIRLEPFERTTLTLNGLWKVQDGVSRIRPAFGDFPDASRDGGFMPIDNIRSFVRNTENNEHRMYWFDPPFFPMLKQSTVLGGLTLNHIVNNSTYWEFGLNYLNIQNSSPTGDNRDTNVVTWFGPFPVDEMPYGKWQFSNNHRIGGYTYAGYDDPAGVAYYRWRSKEGDLYDNTAVHQLRGKFDLASQFDEHHYLKTGIEYNRINLDHKFWERWNRNSYNIYEFNYDRTPSQTGAYLQDQIAYDWMLANIGLRFDYFYGGGGKWPSGDAFATAAFTPQPFGNDTLLVQYLESGKSYIWDLWEEYDRQHPGFLQPVKNHFTISPRIGVSFPVTEDSKFFFNYSHFRSNPPYYSMFLLRYRYTKNGLYNMSNPNLEPPKTISYELGALYNLGEAYSMKASAYYKDVTGQHGEVTYTNSAGDLNYDNWASNNYEDIEGIELSLSKQDNSWITGTVNFNYQLKKSGLTGRQTYSDVAINDDLQGLYAGQESRFLPSPELNATVSFRTPPAAEGADFKDLIFSGWSATFYGQWKLGEYLGTDPDEAADWNPLREEYLQPFMRWPDYYMLDLKLNKSFKIGGTQATFYVEVNNLLNLKVNIMNRNYCFDLVNRDAFNYFASLRLPMYDRAEFDQFRTQYPGWFIAGDDEIGDLQSEEKPYINNPNYPYFMFNAPREVWVGMRIEF